MINLTNMKNKVIREINILDVKDTFEDFDLCIKYLGNTPDYEMVFIKEDFDLEDNDVVAVVTTSKINNTQNITLRRVIKLGDQVQLRDIQNFYEPINIGSSEQEYKILGKAVYSLREFYWFIRIKYKYS